MVFQFFHLISLTWQKLYDQFEAAFIKAIGDWIARTRLMINHNPLTMGLIYADNCSNENDKGKPSQFKNSDFLNWITQLHQRLIILTDNRIAN